MPLDCKFSVPDTVFASADSRGARLRVGGRVGGECAVVDVGGRGRGGRAGGGLVETCMPQCDSALCLCSLISRALRELTKFRNTKGRAKDAHWPPWWPGATATERSSTSQSSPCDSQGSSPEVGGRQRLRGASTPQPSHWARPGRRGARTRGAWRGTTATPCGRERCRRCGGRRADPRRLALRPPRRNANMRSGAG